MTGSSKVYKKHTAAPLRLPLSVAHQYPSKAYACVTCVTKKNQVKARGVRLLYLDVSKIEPVLKATPPSGTHSARQRPARPRPHRPQHMRPLEELTRRTKRLGFKMGETLVVRLKPLWHAPLGSSAS